MRIVFVLFVIVIGVSGFLYFKYPNLPKALAEDSLLVKGNDLMDEKPEGYPEAIFAGGCFWCMESEFRALNGVLYTRAGYSGGKVKDPDYQTVTTGKTGHAEVVEVTFDPEQISYDDLVEFFLLKAHDPTQKNRQGVDVGTQYRSAIFPLDKEQEKTARDVIDRITRNKVYDKPIATQIEPVNVFWPAEDYHQQYYEKYREETGTDHIRVIMKKSQRR